MVWHTGRAQRTVTEGMNHVHAPRVVLAPTKNLKLLTQLTTTSRVWVGNNGFKKKKKQNAAAPLLGLPLQEWC